MNITPAARELAERIERLDENALTAIKSAEELRDAALGLETDFGAAKYWQGYIDGIQKALSEKRYHLAELIQSALDEQSKRSELDAWLPLKERLREQEAAAAALRTTCEAHAKTERDLAMSRCAMETERDGLRDELLRLREIVGPDDVAAIDTALRHESAALRTDRERLDWLENGGIIRQTKTGFYAGISGSMAHNGRTVRDAIDSAMSAEKGAP